VDPYRILHPRKREFTYVPRTAAKNRSRLDFFLISEKYISILDKCTISSSLLTKLFDHKCVFLSLKNNLVRIKKHNIDAAVFKHPRFDAVVQCAVAESYLQHAAPNQPVIDIEVGLREVGFLVEEIRAANDMELELLNSATDQNLQHNYEAVLASIRERLENFPDPDELNTIVLNCDGDIFLEVLMSNVRNTLISFQTWLKNVKNFKKSLLLKEINSEKAALLPNWDSILEKE
jgi:hypothetical protein